LRPLVAPAATGTSGVVNEYPMIRQEWTGQNFGDVYVGTKVNLLSESRRQPLARALRGTVKLPTAGEDNIGTGQFDYFADFVMSKEISRSVEVAGFGRSEEHTSELQSHLNLVCSLLLEEK